MVNNNYKITISKQKFDLEFTTNLRGCFFLHSLLDYEAESSGLLITSFINISIVLYGLFRARSNYGKIFFNF